jgi:hypothetical protein
MIVHRFFSPLRKCLPAKVSRKIRSVFTGLLTPFYFSKETGHFRSAILSRAVDKKGNPLPWYTYPTIDLLSRKDFSGRHVMEFGAGQSTLWWSKRCRELLSYEPDANWYSYLKGRVPDNVKLYHLPYSLDGIESLLGNKQFDMIVVDGFDRFKACQVARRCLKLDGAILLDNSDGLWGPTGPIVETGIPNPIMDFFRAEKFSRIDFFGYAPGVFSPYCTSLFFKDRCFVLEGLENPVPMT